METDLQLGGGYTYQWECAILLALNYFDRKPQRFKPALDDLVSGFLGQVEEIHLEGRDEQHGTDLEDISLIGNERRVLIQVKSKQVASERWTPTDPLFLKALYRFYENPLLTERPTDTRFVFLTNRPFNPALENLQSAARQGQLDRSQEAEQLYGYLNRYAEAEKGTSLDDERFYQLLAHTTLVEYLDVDEVKANVQNKLNALGWKNWEQAHAVLFEHFARQSTRAGGGIVTAKSISQVLKDKEPIPTQFWDRLLYYVRHRDPRGLAAVSIALLSVIGLCIALSTVPTLIPTPTSKPSPSPTPIPMAGDMRIAIAGFAEASHGGESEEGMALAREVYLKVAATFDELQPQFTYEIRPPEQIGTVEGNDFVEMEQWAARIARDHAAYVVVYGILQPKGEEWEVVPLFYVEPDSFDDAQELVGAQALGKPFLASASGEPAALKRVSEAGNARVQVLVRVVMGLSHYVFGEYEQAFAVFQDAEAIGGWKDDQGKEVLYLLLGNAAGKIAGELLADSACSAGVARQKEIAGAEEHLLQAETYYTAALTLDPEYARAYIGQADVLYLRALLPFARSLDYSQIDTHTLDLAIAGYHRAQKAENQPRLANVAAKVHLGIGGCYLMKAFAEGPEAYKLPAIQEFEAVIEAYGDGAEPLLRERAAESYGRLGRIYASFGPDADQDRVIEYYEKVLSLSRIEKRRAIYACRIRQFESGEDCTCNLGGGEQ